MSRLASIENKEFDVVVIGGGIIGAGVARDAALRGLRVALFEKRDFGSGTTAGSTRLIHGGLRYLEMLDFRLVRMDLRERETLLRIAPHLVKPLEFVMPFYRRGFYYRSKIKLGMKLYDLLSYDKTLPRHRFLSPAELERIEPNLRQQGLQGAAIYYDAQADMPERLCLENILDAHQHEAQTFNYTEVTGTLRTTTGDTLRAVRVRDLLNPDEAEVTVKCRVVVNASGAWFDRVAGNLTASSSTSSRIRTTKGVHITCPSVTTRAVVVFSPIDGRLMFVIPWLGYSWLGTTDTDFTDDPARASATAEDVDYLLGSVTEYLPTLETKHIYFSNAGVRALVKEEGSESSISRMHRITDGTSSGANNLISVLGGKLTGYRAIAEEAVDAVCAKLKIKTASQTATLPLPGARAVENTSPHVLKPEIVKHLFGLYGTRATEVITLAASCEGWREPLSPHTPDIAAQVVFAAKTEQCTKLVDFILRRTQLGFSCDQGQSAAPRAASILAQQLGWSEARTATEMREYQNYIAITQAFRNGAAATEQIGDK